MHLDRASRNYAVRQRSLDGRVQAASIRIGGHDELATGRRELEASCRSVREKWGKLTDDDLTVINGKQEQLVGRIQERYGIAKDEAEKQVSSWAQQLS